MKITKVFSVFAKIGEAISGAYENVVDFIDHIVNKEKYERAKRRKTFWTVVLAVAGGIIAVLLFPYRISVKKNGDFEFRSLLLRVYRRTEDYAIPEGGSEDFEIAEADMDESDSIEA